MKKLFSLLVVAISLIAFGNSAVAEEAAAPKKIRVTTQSGVIYEMTEGTDAAGATNYTITAVLVAVTNSATGQTVEVAVNAPTLINATVSGISASSNGTTVSALTITPSGSTTPLTSSQVVATLQTAVTTAITTAVQTGTLPPTTVPPTLTVSNTGGGTVVVQTPPSTPPANTLPGDAGPKVNVDQNNVSNAGGV